MMKAQRVRSAVGTSPYLIKIGFVQDREQTESLFAAVAPYADALAMTNCIAATVRQPSGEAAFSGQPRGIGGEAIRSASIAQVRRFCDAARRNSYRTKIIGVGGVSQADHVREYLDAGAESVQLATATMIDPEVGVNIRREL